jgi:hypothetical protein
VPSDGIVVLVLPTGEVGAWLADELAGLHERSLARAALCVVGGTADQPHVVENVRGNTAAQVPLLPMLAERKTEGVRLVRVVLASGAEPVLDPDEIRSRLDVVIGDRPFSSLNVLVPTEDDVDRATVSADDVLAGWTNLVISPEDHLGAGGVSNPIEVGGTYLAHAACSVATVAGLWTAMDRGPFDELDTTLSGPDGADGDDRGVAVVRTRSRSVLVDEIVDTAIGRALHSVPPASPTYIGPHPAPEYTAPDSLNADAAGRFVRDHPLRFSMEKRAKRPDAVYAGALTLLASALNWLRFRLKGAVVDHARSSLEGVQAAIDRRIQERVLNGEGSAFRVRIFPGDLEGTVVPEGALEDLANVDDYLSSARTQWPYQPPAQAWTDLRELSTGIVDGGPVPDAAVQRVLEETETTTRAVVFDRSKIVGRPAAEVPDWQPPAALAHAVGWPPARWRRNDARRVAKVRRRLDHLEEHPEDLPKGVSTEDVVRERAALDQALAPFSCLHLSIASGLSGEIDAAIAMFTELEEAARAEVPLPEQPRLRKGFKRVLLYTIGLAAAVVIAVVLPLVLLVYLLALVFFGLWWAASVVITVLGWMKNQWADELQRRDREALRTWASLHLDAALAEVFRLSANYEQFLDWSQIIGEVVDDPFGPPALFESTVEPLQLPRILAHQVANASTTAAGFRGATKEVARLAYGADWLGSALDLIERRSIEAFGRENGLKPDEIIVPVHDGTIDLSRLSADHESSRRSLLAAVGRPASRYAAREARWRSVREGLVLEPVADLVDQLEADGLDVGGGAAEIDAFLRAAVEGGGPSAFLRTIWDTYESPSPSSTLAFVPPGIEATGAEAVVPVRVDPVHLLVQAVGIDWVEQVPLSELTVLSPSSPRAIPASDLEPTAPIVDCPAVVADQVRAGQRQATMRTLDAFGPGSTIEPEGEVLEPPDEGSYAFLIEVDGEPARRPLDEPVDVVLRSIGGPEHALDLVRTALQEISNTCGLRFRYLGTTVHLPRLSESDELWIGWVFPEEEERFLDGTAAGLGGGRATMPASGPATLTGAVARVKAGLPLADGFGPGSIGSVLLHELGHALNLAHVDDLDEVMHPGGPGGPEMFGPGDRRGLWLLGVGRGTSSGPDSESEPPDA